MDPRWKYDYILRRCLFVMGLFLSLPRVDFSLYRAQAKVSSSEIDKLKQKLKDLPGSKVKRTPLWSLFKTKLETIGSVFDFADNLGLTEEEWELLRNFLVPTLTQIRG